MPILVMSAKLCPDHVEGTVYALTCCVNNIASQVAGNFSAWLATGYGITLSDFTSLWKLHLTVVCLSVVPLAVVWMTPERPGEGNPDDVKRVRADAEVNKVIRKHKEESHDDYPDQLGAQSLARGNTMNAVVEKLHQSKKNSKRMSTAGMERVKEEDEVDEDEDLGVTFIKPGEEKIVDVLHEQREKLKQQKAEEEDEDIVFGVYSGIPRSVAGGTVLLIVLFVGLLWSITDAIVRLAQFEKAKTKTF
jgi:hypothetical protein